MAKALGRTKKTPVKPVPVEETAPVVSERKKKSLRTDPVKNPYGIDLAAFTVVPADKSPKRPVPPDFKWEEFVVLTNDKYFTCARNVNYNSNLMTFKQLANNWAKKLTELFTQQGLISTSQRLVAKYQVHPKTSDEFLFAFHVKDRELV